MSSNINIVLVNTSHSGNIGSTARAMKTMGLKNLVLVSPKNFPSDIANAQAVGCADVLENAITVDTLSEALTKSKLVVGFSARQRRSNVSSLSIEELISLLKDFQNKDVSIVFGNEQSGLSNEELQLCNHIVTIPTDSAYSSLNLASAVQIFSYEYFKNTHKIKDFRMNEDDIVPHSTKNHIIKTFLSLMNSLDIITDKNEKSLNQNVHIIFNKFNFSEKEANLFIGVLNRIQKALKK